jgi:hypothetical protein
VNDTAQQYLQTFRAVAGLVRQIIAMIQVIQGAGTDVKALRAYLMSLSHETLLRLFVTLCTMGVTARWIYLRAIRELR